MKHTGNVGNLSEQNPQIKWLKKKKKFPWNFTVKFSELAFQHINSHSKKAWFYSTKSCESNQNITFTFRDCTESFSQKEEMDHMPSLKTVMNDSISESADWNLLPVKSAVEAKTSKERWNQLQMNKNRVLKSSAEWMIFIFLAKRLLLIERNKL